MAERRPLVSIGGRLKELPTTDTLPENPKVYGTYRAGTVVQTINTTKAAVSLGAVNGEWLIRSAVGDFTAHTSDIAVERSGDYKIEALLFFDQTSVNARTSVFAEIQKKPLGGSYSRADGDWGGAYSRMTSRGEGQVRLIADAHIAAGDLVRIRAWTVGTGGVQILMYGVTVRFEKMG